ncbi:MAG TPA: glycosyltransferase family 39 protein, partial [Anaerolineales bacterium]|nr:glycosyltransferase family 39 protein [Anaerolineales bacterium]
MSDEHPNPNQYPLGEPSVLDYVKSLFRSEKVEAVSPVETIEDKPLTPFPWRVLLAFGLAVIGQIMFEPPHARTEFGFVFYIAAFALLGWAFLRGEWTLPSLAPTSHGTDPLTVRLWPFLSAVLLFWLAFILLGGSQVMPGFSLPDSIAAYLPLEDNQFTGLNFSLWILVILFLIRAFWLNRNVSASIIDTRNPLLPRNMWIFLLIAATALVLFFRFSGTPSVPPEPFSDHAEKIVDVYEVSTGETHIFFTRNTGREAFQMYWTLFIAQFLGTGFSFLSLKLGTALLGFLTLPFIYLLGKEIGGSRVGLFAFLLAGIGYWPNVISRVGLRFPLYPLFVAPTLLYLIRGLRTRNRNDFLLAGLFLGIGLHGYSPMRIVPFIVVIAFLLYWLHSQSKGARKELPVWLTMLALVSLFVFLPLLRYWLANPEEFGFRAFTRLGGVEQPLPGPAWQIFFSNFWNAIRMFNYDDGEIWVHSVTHRPALDIVSAALFLIGVVLLLVRYIRQRHWLDLFLLVSIPLLLMPSILSLAFPGENPALNRAGGVYVVVFVIVALALDGFLTSLGRGGTRNALIWGLAGLLLLVSASQNYDLVFNQYYNSFRTGSWNSSDMGKTIQEFEQTYQRTDTVWIVPFPHWVD